MTPFIPRGLPRAICSAQPTTDTYSLSQGQDEFYFVLPFDRMDIILCGMNGGKTTGEVVKEAGLTAEQVERVFRDIRTKRSTTRPLHLGPAMVEAVAEITK